MTRAYNTATTQQNSGGAVAGVTAGKNPVLNSNFSVWQRGTSAALGSVGVVTSADRWATYSSPVGTMSRQLTGDTTNLPFIQYCARVQRNAGDTAANIMTIGQSFETINSIPFVGRTVTLSYYARKGANYSSASDALSAFVRTGTGTDQNVIATGYTGSSGFSGTATLTSTWQRFTVTGTIATNVTEIGIEFRYTTTGTAGAADYFEVTGVQLEVGSVATPYAPYSATYQGELAACQRYYWRHTAGAATVTMAMGISESATTNWVPINNVVPLRVPATSIDISGLNCTDAVSFTSAVGSATISSASTLMTRAVFNTSGQTSKQAIFITSQASGSYIGVSAEL